VPKIIFCEHVKRLYTATQSNAKDPQGYNPSGTSNWSVMLKYSIC